MSESSDSKPSMGCFSLLLMLLLLAAAAGLGVAIYLMLQPQDMRDIGGRDTRASEGPVRDMRVVLKNAIDRGYSVALTEAEINRWLGRVLVTRQAGLLDGVVKLSRVSVRLADGHAEVIMEREIKGHAFTTSMFFIIQQSEGEQGVRTEIMFHGGPYHPSLPHPQRGGRFGRLVVPQGFLILVMPAYRELAEVFKHEIDLGFRKMDRIRIEKKRLILDPRSPTADAGKATRAF